MTNIATPIFVNPNYAKMLRGLWTETEHWILAAEGQIISFNNPIGRMLARDLANKSLDRYWQAIEDLLPKDKEQA